MQFLFILFTFISCWSSDPIIEKEELERLAKKASADMVFMIPKGISEHLVNCNDYYPKCKAGYRIKVKLLEFNALMYANTEQAQLSARSMQGYYSFNWAFDQVRGEPILERYVEEAFQAKKAF